MVLLSQRDTINSRITSRNKILATLLTGVVFLTVPILLIFLDPIQMIVNYRLRLAKGTVLYNILQHDFPSTCLSIYMFNITNADRFLSGEDYKLKVEEVGPFVYKEYRRHEDIEFSEDGQYMGMTPRMRAEFIPEASIGHPRDVYLTVPNLPFLGSVGISANYPVFVQYAFNMWTAQQGAKAFIQLDVDSILWGYKNPLVTVINSLVPGLVHFDDFGILDRLYENESDYRIVVGATQKERFKIKSVKKFTHVETETIKNVEESELFFDDDTYEGGAYPPMLTPDVPISLYRIGVCRTWFLDYIGSRTMEYGGEALVYTISNKTYINNSHSVSLKNYPDGLMDVSECFYNFPFVLSNTHFVDCDPKVTERIDGLKPDREANFNEIVIDRKASITVSTKLSIQLSMILDDLSTNSHTKMMSNSVIPITYFQLDQPKMTEWTMWMFVLVYRIAPIIVLCLEILSAAIGLAFLGLAFRLVYLNSRTRGLVFQSSVEEKLIYIPVIRK